MRAHLKLLKWRLLTGLSQRRVAQKARIPQGVWSLIERGKRDPSLPQAFQIERLTSGAVMASEWPSKSILKAVQPLLSTGT